MPKTSPPAHAATAPVRGHALQGDGQSTLLNWWIAAHLEVFYFIARLLGMFTKSTKGDQPRFERWREGIGPAVCGSTVGRGENVTLASATLPQYEDCPARRLLPGGRTWAVRPLMTHRPAVEGEQ